MKQQKDYSELKAQIKALHDNAETGRSEKEERFRKSYLYYACLAPERQGNEMSGYVEPVLRKAVEAVKPSLMNIFTENEKKAVQFRPLSKVPFALDLERFPETGLGIAGLIDDYINKVFINENAGFDILDRAITEALVSGDVFLKYFLEEDVVEETFELDKVPEEDLDEVLADFPDTDFDKMDKALSRRKGLVSGKFKAKRIEKKIRIEFVPFADIYINGKYENIKDARYVCQRIGKTVGDLYEMGYLEELIESSVSHRTDEYLSTQTLINSKSFGEEDDLDAFVDPMERPVDLYEHYFYTSLVDNKKGKSKLYRVVSTSTEILEVEPASRIPFVHGVMERIPGSFWGVSMYDKFGPIQDMISRLMRAVEYNAADGAYGRYIAIKTQYDRASLMNNRPGSIIEVNQGAGLDAIRRFPKEDLPPTVDGLIARLTQNYKEDAMSAVGVDVSGANISATAAAITANSADMKDKVIARTLAYTLFRPLFEGIYDILVSENIKIGEVPNPQIQEAMAGIQSGELPQEVLMEIPEMLPITGADLPDVADFLIDVNTANDDAILNSQIINLVSLFAQIPQGLVDTREVAAQLTGLSIEEIGKFFPVAPEPTPEQQEQQAAVEQLQMEAALLNNDLLKSQVGKTAAETFQIEQKIEQDVKDAESKRLREEEKSIQEFQRLELKTAEMEAELRGEKIQISDI